MNEKTEKIIVPIHQSLTNPVLYAGAERELTIIIAFSAMIVWVSGKDFVSIILALVFWFVGILLARMAAFCDPQLTKIFIRHLRYQDFYPATEKIDTPIRRK